MSWICFSPLHLTECNTHECLQCLSDILIENVGIQKLLLNSINIGDEVLVPSCRSLSHSHYLLLQCNIGFVFSFQGAKSIANMLKKNKSIRILQLSNNAIEYSVCTSIHKTRSWIRKGKELPYPYILERFWYYFLLFSLETGFCKYCGSPSRE
jgi:hypothetical protein